VNNTSEVAGAVPEIGSRLGRILEDAGLETVRTFAVQAYLAPHDPAGPALLVAVIRSLFDVIVKYGIATAEQVGVETLEGRMADELRRANAVFLPPTVVGAWARRPGGR
jgi:hypothetical protein